MNGSAGPKSCDISSGVGLGHMEQSKNPVSPWSLCVFAFAPPVLARTPVVEEILGKRKSNSIGAASACKKKKIHRRCEVKTTERAYANSALHYRWQHILLAHRATLRATKLQITLYTFWKIKRARST